MHSELLNLSLFVSAIAKVLLMTGVGVAILFVYVAEKLVSANRVPARNQGERWLAWKKQLSRSRKFAMRPIAPTAKLLAMPRNLHGNPRRNGKKIRRATA